MSSSNVHYCLGASLGACVGYAAWLHELESDQMKGIIFRSNERGEKVFTPYNVLLYMAAPFQYTFFWSTEFLVHNWVVMCCAGAITGTILVTLIDI